VKLGATAVEGGVEFCVWAPAHERVEVVTSRGRERLPMRPVDDGYHELFVEGLGPGARYRFGVGGTDLPDPASRSQPDDVHGDSEVVEPAFAWSDREWVGRVITDYLVMEVHVGTFTPEGTLDAAIGRLDELAALGITAVELMPVAEFPGSRNWGYDGVFPYAVESSYGGPGALRRFVDGAHSRGIAVVLDVVSNHLGPDGNVLSAFGPYFTDRYRTPWGAALNIDGHDSDPVRRYFLDNALMWIADFQIDALRLDAVHAIVDPSAYPFVEELVDVVHRYADEAGRHVWVIAESAANDARLITPKERGGIGCDAQWNDDFHHALHVLLTGERHGYYADFGAVGDLAAAYREGFVYAGRYSPFRRRRHGRSSAGLPGERFVVFAQNHDHVGNRALGDRLSTTVDAPAAKLAAAAVLCAPFVPLLFMGEEYGETNPFPYFVSHTDPALVEAVRRGRADEFAEFHASVAPPDPQAVETFEHAKLDWEKRGREPHASMLAWYRSLIELRATRPALALPVSVATVADVLDDALALVVRREAADDMVVVVLGFDDRAHDIELALPVGTWRVLADTHGGERGLAELFDSEGTVTAKLPGVSAMILGYETVA